MSTPVYVFIPKPDTSCPNSSRPILPPSPPTSAPPPPPPPLDPLSSLSPSWRHPSSQAPLEYPYHAPVRTSNAATIYRVKSSLRSITSKKDELLDTVTTPTAVSIGPYHATPRLAALMHGAKLAAQEEFFRVARQPRHAVRERMLALAGPTRRCYADDWTVHRISDGALADMMFVDGCFLVQFMVSMCPDDPDAPPEADPLMSRAEVQTCIDAIARDVMLFENQIPWAVIQALMEMRPGGAPVDRFLDLMATSAFHVGNDHDSRARVASLSSLSAPDPNNHGDPPPSHLLGLFHRRRVGLARTQSLRVPRLSSLSTTAVELAEMGVKLATSKTNTFGDMRMTKRHWSGGLGLGLFGKLSLAPLVLDELSSCWLLNMAAYEACLGATRADNFAVSSYVCVVARLVNREEDVQELRGKGVINSAMSDRSTLEFFKRAAPHLRVGHRYYQVFRELQEYRQERWLWIAIHRFLYRNFKTIAAVLSIIGVLAGLFKTIMSLKQQAQP